MAKFQKGQSGNPGGRPKAVHNVQALAREHSEEAIETLLEVMRSEQAAASARVAAANAILDRGYGKPAQLTLTDPASMRKASDLTDDELLALIERSMPADEGHRH